MKSQITEQKNTVPDIQISSEIIKTLIDYIYLLKKGGKYSYERVIDTYILFLKNIGKMQASKYTDALFEMIVEEETIYSRLITIISNVVKSDYRDRFIKIAQKKGNTSWLTIIKLLGNEYSVSDFSDICEENITDEKLKDLLYTIDYYIWIKYATCLLDDDKCLDLKNQEQVKNIIEKCASLSRNENPDIATRAIKILVTIKRCVDLRYLKIDENILKPQYIETLFHASIKKPYLISDVRYFDFTDETIEYFVKSQNSKNIDLLKQTYKTTNTTILNRLGYFWFGIFVNAWEDAEILQASKYFLSNDRLSATNRNNFRKKMFEKINLVIKASERDGDIIENERWKTLRNIFIRLTYTSGNNSYLGLGVKK